MINKIKCCSLAFVITQSLSISLIGISVQTAICQPVIKNHKAFISTR